MNQLPRQARGPAPFEHTRSPRKPKLLPLICCLILLAAGAPVLAQADDLALKSQRAAQALREKRFTEAITLYRELIDEIPNHPGLILNLGLALHSSGQYEHAIEQFQFAVKLKSDLAPAWLFIGLDYQKLGRPAKAVQPLERALQLQPTNGTARLELADALYSLHRYDDAASHFKELTEAEPLNPRAWLGLGLSYASLSSDASNKLEKLAPESGYHYLLLAQSRADQQQFRSAFHYYREALARRPNLVGVHVAIAEIYRETGHADWAEDEEQKENQSPIDCDKQPLMCLFAEGRHADILERSVGTETAEPLYWRARSYGELARQAHEKLAELPPSGELHQLRAGVLDLQRRHREAAEEWRNSLKYRPGDRHLQIRLAKSLWFGRDYEAMKPLVEELLKASPSSELHFLFGDALLNEQQVDKAIPHLEAAVTNDPEMLSAHASLARAYLRAGQEKKSIRHLQAALTTDEDGSLHYQLARAYQSAGQTEQAKEALAKYQEIQKAARQSEAERHQELQITAP